MAGAHHPAEVEEGEVTVGLRDSLNRRASATETLAGIALAIAIGIAGAATLYAWWILGL